MLWSFYQPVRLWSCWCIRAPAWCWTWPSWGWRRRGRACPWTDSRPPPCTAPDKTFSLFNDKMNFHGPTQLLTKFDLYFWFFQRKLPILVFTESADYLQYHKITTGLLSLSTANISGTNSSFWDRQTDGMESWTDYIQIANIVLVFIIGGLGNLFTIISVCVCRFR